MGKAARLFKEYLKPQRGKGKSIAKDWPLGVGKIGFLAPELLQFAYALVTAALILFAWTSISHPTELLLQRVLFLSGTLALWVVSLLWPCKLMTLLRYLYLIAMLGSWYPDTYEINRHFGCLDHVFASYEQDLFGCQPALLFSQQHPSAVVSEFMYMGYVSYYLFFTVSIVLVFFRDYKQVERVAMMIFGGFFLCYCIYLVMPVTGPQYYYLAVGTEQIAAGTFPDVGRFFEENTEAMQLPGWTEGLFYRICQFNHDAGERPTAAFPSSHVAIATLVMLIAMRMRMWKNLLVLAVPYIFLCLSTVYITAHYAIDSIAGFLFGVMLFFLFGGMKLTKVGR